MHVQIQYLTILDSSNSLHVDSNNFDFFTKKISIFGSLCSATSEQVILLWFFFPKNIHHACCKPNFGMHELSSSLAMKTYKIY